jgi:putative N6-adenine-specific DNA methylase
VENREESTKKSTNPLMQFDRQEIITLKTFFGLEEVLAEELKELGFEPTILNRAVQTKGTWKDIYFLNLHVRCAISILVEIKKFTLRTEDDLYKKCMQINWTNYFAVDKTFVIKGAIYSDFFKNSHFPFLVVKDAIVDTFRAVDGNRPDINTKSPQVVIDLYVNNDVATLSLNTSGLPLFQRGYRQTAGDAPLNEVVAAGLIRLSGWDKTSTFMDPFCGSGTLLIEAALLAVGIPSNIERQHYAFKNFANYNPTAWEEIYTAATKRITSLPCRIIGSDNNDEMLTKTRRNLRALPIGRFVETAVHSFHEVKCPEEKGIVLTNPPYGERMGDNIEELYAALGDWMKNEMKGFNCWIISSSESGFKSIGLRPDRKIKLYNGELECSFRKFGIYDGTKKIHKLSPNE